MAERRYLVRKLVRSGPVVRRIMLSGGDEGDDCPPVNAGPSGQPQFGQLLCEGIVLKLQWGQILGCAMLLPVSIEDNG